MSLINNINFSNLQNYSINGKDIYIVDDHQFVLPIWANFSVSTNQTYNLVTFDFHTDTRPAFNRYASVKKSNSLPKIRNEFRESYIDKINPKDLGKILEVTRNLANDEHIYAALDFGYVSKAQVINLENTFSDLYISYYRTKNLFDIEPLKKLVNPYENDLKEYRLNRLEDNYINDAKFKLFSGSFILDFDLDYFPTRESLEPKNRKIITNLISKAKIITIAREKVFFQEKCEQVGFSETEAESLLLKLIETITA